MKFETIKSQRVYVMQEQQKNFNFQDSQTFSTLYKNSNNEKKSVNYHKKKTISFIIISKKNHRSFYAKGKQSMSLFYIIAKIWRMSLSVGTKEQQQIGLFHYIIKIQLWGRSLT